MPLAFEVGSGNQADKAVFAQRFQGFAQEWSQKQEQEQLLWKEFGARQGD